MKYKFVSFYNDGQLHELGNYLSDNKTTKHGEWCVFQTNGNILEKGVYDHGDKVGEWKEIDNETGNFWIGPYTKGKKDGIWRNENRTREYKNGKQKGGERILNFKR